MEFRGQQSKSYERAMQNTFKTTYGSSYTGVDTLDRSPLYRERNYDPTILPHERAYERESYPYHQEDHEEGQAYVTRNPAPWKSIYNYDYEPGGYHPDDPRHHESQPRHHEVQAMPIEKKSCHACKEPEAYSPKNNYQLRCMHKYCDNCIQKLYQTTEKYRGVGAKFYHCAFCPSSKTAGPTVIKFDPYGRRIVPLPAWIHGTDPVEEKYNPVLANPDEVDLIPHDRSFCHSCFKTGDCVNKVGCNHRYCDFCFNKLHCSDNPFRYTTCLHYFCKICKEKTPESKVIRYDPYGRRLWKFHDVRYYNYM